MPNHPHDTLAAALEVHVILPVECRHIAKPGNQSGVALDARGKLAMVKRRFGRRCPRSERNALVRKVPEYLNVPKVELVRL